MDIWLVIEETGEYSSAWREPIWAFATEQEAQTAVIALKALALLSGHGDCFATQMMTVADGTHGFQTQTYYCCNTRVKRGVGKPYASSVVQRLVPFGQPEHLVRATSFQWDSEDNWYDISVCQVTDELCRAEYQRLHEQYIGPVPEPEPEPVVDFSLVPL